MKKIYLLLTSLLVVSGLMAQYDVTFQVDMNQQTVSGNGVHIAGDFQSEAGAPMDWDPAATTMTDGDNDGIYDVTVNIPAGRYEFKFINDNDWPGAEAVPAVAQVDEGLGNENRYFWVSSDSTFPAIEFAGAAPAGMKFVKLKVDMRNQLDANSNPNVLGEWDSYANEVLVYDPEGDSTYYNYVYWAGPDTMTYKFRNTSDWNDAESVTDPVCGGAGGFGNDRWIDAASDVISINNCYGACGPCVAAAPTDTINVTLRVDMSYEKVCNTPDSVDVTGAGPAFGDWGTDPIIMSDDDNDDVWEVTIQLATNTPYEFKYRNRIGGNAKWESSANRMFETSVNADVTLDLVCFEQTTSCAASGPAPFGPADVTFAVDMVNEVPGDTIWVMSSFTDPQWQGGAVALEYTGEGAVFATKIEVCPNNFQFKFVNGDVNTVANEEFNGDTVSLPCNTDNGVGGYNRSYMRSAPGDIVIAYIFSTCDTFAIDPLSVGEVTKELALLVYPNPVNDLLNVNASDNIAYVTITDLSGRTVATVAGNQRNTLTLSTADLGMTSGLYLVRVTAENGTEKVVKISTL